MAYCIYCGKELINGRCNCPEFRAHHPEYEDYDQADYTEPQGKKNPFFIPSFNPSFRSVSSFFSSIRDMTGMSEPIADNQDPYEHNVPIVPDCIEPEDNEVIVKQYNLALLRTRLKFMKAEGRMMVTNRRVLFRAAGTSLTGNILQEHQFNLDEIAGIEIHKDYKFSFLSFIGAWFLSSLVSSLPMLFLMQSSGPAAVLCGMILGFLGLAFNIVVYGRFWRKLFCAAISTSSFVISYGFADNVRGLIGFFVILSVLMFLVDLVIVCFVPNLVVKIKTKGGLGAIELGSQKAIFQRRTGDEYSGFAEIMPWEDTVMAMNELGTMIDDLQKLGDYAVEKWA